MTCPHCSGKSARRAADILRAAVDTARSTGYNALTSESVAAAAGCNRALINRYFTDMAGLRVAVMEEAIRREILPIVAQGIALGDTVAVAAPLDLRARAIASLA